MGKADLENMCSAALPIGKIVIRPSRPCDDWAVGELLVEAFEKQYARKLPGHTVSESRKLDLRNQVTKRAYATVLVAEYMNEIVGTVSLYQWQSPGSDAWIEGAADLRLLGVRPDCQGSGVSARLLNEAETIARSWRATAVCLHVRRHVHGVAKLYRQRGYQRCEEGDIDHLPEVFLEAYYLPVNSGLDQ